MGKRERGWKRRKRKEERIGRHQLRVKRRKRKMEKKESRKM